MHHSENNQLGQFIPLHYHFQMLTDSARVNAFKTAINDVVRPNHTVVELGSGTGIMSFFAAKKGANVISVEFNPSMVSASKKFLHENGVANQVKIVENDAGMWLPSDPADFVICEMLHSALLREKQVEVISSFRENHLAYFGKIPQFIPSATLLAVQPIYQNYDFNGYHAEVPLFQSAYTKNDDCIECINPQVYKIIDYSTVKLEKITATVEFAFNENINVNALRFITKSILKMDLTSGKTVDWHNQHLVLPLRHEHKLTKGQKMKVSFSYMPGDGIEVLNNSIDVQVDGVNYTKKSIMEDTFIADVSVVKISI